MLVSSAFQLLGAAQATFGSVSVGSERSKLKLTLAYIATLVVSGLIMLLGILGVYSTFFVENVGVTFTDGLVYTMVILFFLVGRILYLRLYFKSKSQTCSFMDLPCCYTAWVHLD